MVPVYVRELGSVFLVQVGAMDVCGLDHEDQRAAKLLAGTEHGVVLTAYPEKSPMGMTRWVVAVSPRG